MNLSDSKKKVHSDKCLSQSQTSNTFFYYDYPVAISTTNWLNLKNLRRTYRQRMVEVWFS